MPDTGSRISPDAAVATGGKAVVRMRPAVAIRPAARDDIGTIVAMHQLAFERFFLTSLGPWFLTVYYRLIADFSAGILLVAVSRGTVVGFVAGFAHPALFYRYLWAHRMVLAVPALCRVLPRPRALLRIAMIVRSRHPGRAGHSRHAGRACELAALGVAPEARRMGVGADLVTAFLRRAGEHRVAEVRLTTDAVDNDAVIRFYESLGFHRVRTFVAPIRRTMHEYATDLVSPEPSGEGG